MTQTEVIRELKRQRESGRHTTCRSAGDQEFVQDIFYLIDQLQEPTGREVTFITEEYHKRVKEAAEKGFNS